MQNYTLVSRYQLLHHAFDFACYSNVKERFRNRAKDARPSHNCLFIPRMPPRKLVGLDRFELSASSLSGTRSNQLSYKPIDTAGSNLVETIGIEPTTSALQRRRSPN